MNKLTKMGKINKNTWNNHQINDDLLQQEKHIKDIIYPHNNL